MRLDPVPTKPLPDTEDTTEAELGRPENDLGGGRGLVYYYFLRFYLIE